nr:VPLPA-CTERM sorting domain-containing protein [Stagnihabitans tardus]
MGSNFNPGPAVSGLGTGSVITSYGGSGSGALSGGLAVTGAAQVTVTVMAFQRAVADSVTNLDDALTATTANLGQSFFSSVLQSSLTTSYVALGFNNISNNGSIGNGDAFNSGANGNIFIAFSAIFNGGKSVYALFEDGKGSPDFNNDYDDMIVRIDLTDITPVPAPAAGLLLLSGLAGLGLMRRRKQS